MFRSVSGPATSRFGLSTSFLITQNGKETNLRLRKNESPGATCRRAGGEPRRQAEASSPAGSRERGPKPRKVLYFPRRYAQSIALILKNTTQQQEKQETERKTAKRARKVEKKTCFRAIFQVFGCFWLFSTLSALSRACICPKYNSYERRASNAMRITQREGVLARQSSAAALRLSRTLCSSPRATFASLSLSLSFFHHLSLSLPPSLSNETIPPPPSFSPSTTKILTIARCSGSESTGRR